MSGAKNTAAEVGVKLVLDSNAKAESQHIAAGLKHVDASIGQASTSWKEKLGGGMKMVGGLAMGAASAAITASAAAGAAIIGLGVKSAHAFMESEEQVRGLASTLTLIDQNGNGFEELHGYATGLKDEMEELGMQAGQTDDAMVAVFTDIVERGGKSVEAAKKLTEEMAYAGRALPGGPEALSQGFESIQMGMIKAKNPLVQLIAATGTLKGSAKAVAKEMKGMSIDKQMELAEKAIGKMSTKMKAAPMTIGQMKTSMSVAIGNVFETAGEPIVRAIEPVFEKVRSLLLGNGSNLQDAAKKFGEFISKPVGLVIPIIDGLVKAIGDSWGDIMKTFDTVYGPFNSAVHYLYDNKEAFAQTIADAATMFIKAADALIRASVFIRDSILGTIVAVMKSGAMGEQAQQYAIDQQQKTQVDDMRAQIQKKGVGGRLDDADTNMRRAQFIQTADGTKGVAQAGENFDAAYRRAMDDHTAVLDEVGKQRDAAQRGDTAAFMAAWDAAEKANDEGAKLYVAKFLDGQDMLEEALSKGSVIWKNGMGSFLDTLKSAGLKDEADRLKEATKPKLGVTGKTNLTQNFNGAINIKQDFRDQDPDRVATVFKEDLARVGSSRLQSRYAGAFGF